MDPQSSSGSRHSPGLLSSGGQQPSSQPPGPQPACDMASPQGPFASFGPYQVSVLTPDLAGESRKRKREEEEEGLAPHGPLVLPPPLAGAPLHTRTRAALQPGPPPDSPMLMDLFDESGDIQRQVDHASAQDLFKSLPDGGWGDSIGRKARHVASLTTQALHRLNPQACEMAGERLGRELQADLAGPSRARLLFGITHGYASWAGSLVLEDEAQAQARSRGEAALAGLLRGLARSPAGCGPDRRVSLACEFLQVCQSMPANPPADGKGRTAGDAKAHPASTKAELISEQARRGDGKAPRRLRERILDSVSSTLGNEDLYKRLLAVACLAEGGRSISAGSLEALLRAALRNPQEAAPDGTGDMRENLDARDIANYLDAVLEVVREGANGRGRAPHLLPAMVRALLSLDVHADGLTHDEIGLAVGWVADRCLVHLDEARSLLQQVLDARGPGLRTRGAVALALGAVNCLSAEQDVLICNADDRADLTVAIRVELDAALGMVGWLAEGEALVRQDLLLRSLLAYRQQADHRLRLQWRRDRLDALHEGRPFVAADTPLKRFDLGLANLIARYETQAGHAEWFEWLVRYGRCVRYDLRLPEVRQTLRESLLPAGLRPDAAQPGESAAQAHARQQRAAALLVVMDRAMALAETPMAVLYEPALRDDEARVHMLFLSGYLHTRTAQELARKVSEVVGSAAPLALREAILGEVLAHTRAPGHWTVQGLLASTSSSSSSSSAVVQPQPLSLSPLLEPPSPLLPPLSSAGIHLPPLSASGLPPPSSPIDLDAPTEPLPVDDPSAWSPAWTLADLPSAMEPLPQGVKSEQPKPPL